MSKRPRVIDVLRRDLGPGKWTYTGPATWRRADGLIVQNTTGGFWAYPPGEDGREFGGTPFIPWCVRMSHGKFARCFK